MVLREDNVIETVTGDRSPHYEPFGWHHWPEHPWLSYQFRRGLGETQEGGGDTESWHREWQAWPTEILRAARTRRRVATCAPR